MFEIEAKVRLSGADFQRLKKEIPAFARKKESVKIADRYYGNPKTFSLRIREKGKKALLNIKNKKRGEGIEMNQEIELPLADASGFHHFLKKIGIPIYITKKKDSELYKYDDFQIELHKVGELGPFLEIETLVESEAAIPKAKKALRGLFKKLGFSPEDFERKYYLELLEEKRKNK